MLFDYASLTPGQEVSRETVVMDNETVASYVYAVRDGSFGTPIMQDDRCEQSYVPAMAIAAMSVRGVVNDLQIPGGTLHLGQEMQFLEMVSLGETLMCVATIVQNSVRRGQRILVVSLEVVNSLGQKIMSGKSTIAVPA